MSKIKKPNDDILKYISENYFYQADGTINGKFKINLGELDARPTRTIVRIKIKGKNYKRYHLVWFLCKGEWPTTELDHEDRNSLNDKIDNLREVDHFLQQQNRDDYRGYRWFSIENKLDGQWRKKNIRVFNQTRKIYLGYVEKREDAIEMIDDYYKGVEGESVKNV